MRRRIRQRDARKLAHLDYPHQRIHPLQRQPSVNKPNRQRNERRRPHQHQPQPILSRRSPPSNLPKYPSQAPNAHRYCANRLFSHCAPRLCFNIIHRKRPKPPRSKQPRRMNVVCQPSPARLVLRSKLINQSPIRPSPRHHRKRIPPANSTLPSEITSDLPRNCSSAASSGSSDSPKCRAKAFALPIGTIPIAATGAPASPCITSCTVPSPPQANTTFAPACAAARACAPADPAASVRIASTECPRPANVSATRAIVSSRPTRPPPDAGLKISTNRTPQFYGPVGIVASIPTRRASNKPWCGKLAPDSALG